MPQMPRKETYLGDGLYATYDGYQICLMANSHTSPTDMVYLDPHVYASLLRFVEQFNSEQNESDSETPEGEK